jgi:hypothetical protein
MNIGIVGGRDFNNYDILVSTFANLVEENKWDCKGLTIVSGGAKGADSLAEQLANDIGTKTLIFKANWDKYGKSAGYRRNVAIVENSDIIIAFWNGISKGTRHTIDIAKVSKKCLFVYDYSGKKVFVE